MSDNKNADIAGQPKVQTIEDYEYSTLMHLLGVSVSKHLLDEHFTLIGANSFFYNVVGYSQAEFESGFRNCMDEYFHNNPAGFQLLIKSLSDALDKGETGNTVYLPLQSPEGEHRWVKLQGSLMEDTIEGYRVVCVTMNDVTEMMLAQREQEQTRQVFEKLTHEQDMLMSALNVSVSKHLIDEHYTCVRANEYYYQLIGYPKEEYETLFHNHPDEYYGNNPEGWAMLTEKVTEIMEQGEDQFELIVPMKYKDGSSYWVKLFGYFTDEYIDGCRVSYTVMTDVTTLVQMKNEQEMLMQAMKVSVSRHLVDEHFTVVWANKFYYQLIGYTQLEYENLFHNHCDEYFQDNIDGWHKIHEKIQEMFAAGENSYELFVPLKIPDGSISWVKMTGFFTDEYQDGKQLAYTTMVGVTDMIQIQREKAVAYDNIPGFIVKHRIMPEKIVMVEASDRIVDIFDVEIDKIAAFDVYAALEPESRAIIEANHVHLRRGEPFDGTIRMKDRYGRERWFQIHSTCVDSIADDPVYLSVFIDITDITELRKMQREIEERTEMLNAALEEAKRANTAKSDFLSRMSHDIRTPMNAIFGMTTIAASHIHDPERIADCLGKITVSSKLLLSLINEILDTSKIESGRIVLAEEEVNLAELVQGVVTMIQPQIIDKNLLFKAYVNNIVHETVISDIQRMQQLLLNLLSNAVKYTQEGGSVQLEINERPSEYADMMYYEFIISDTGIGMKSEFLQHAFEPFERASDEKIQAVQGTGLGLAICKSIAELMGGSVQVESSYGEGSRFTVTICLHVQEETADDGVLANLPVLVVDDDEYSCRNTCERLAELGITAEWVTDGMAALRQVEQAHAVGTDYFAVLLDYRMPEPDGIETACRIRELVGSDLPIIMVSAYDSSMQVDAAKQAGANDFITKPLFRSRLAYKLKQLMAVGGAAEPLVQQPVSDSCVGKRILLVEDNELNCEIAKELLLCTGAAVDTAENGRIAVDMIENSPAGTYDLIFMDMQMPVMNGCEATVKIRALPREDVKRLPIIAMTANAFADDQQKTREAGMNGHMAKPIDLEQLHQVLQKWL